MNIETGILPVVQIKTVLNWIQRGHTARARVQARRPLGLGPTPGAGGALGARAGRHPRPRNGKSRSGTVLSRLAGHWVSDLPVSESNPPVPQCTFPVLYPDLNGIKTVWKQKFNCFDTEQFPFQNGKYFCFPPKKTVLLVRSGTWHNRELNSFVSAVVLEQNLGFLAV